MTLSRAGPFSDKSADSSGRNEAPRSSVVVAVLPFVQVYLEVPEQPTYLFGHVLPDAVQNVLILCGHGRAGPPHNGHGCGCRHCEDEQDSRSGMTGIVESGVPKTRFFKQCFPLVIVGAELDGPRRSLVRSTRCGGVIVEAARLTCDQSRRREGKGNNCGN